MHAHLLLCEPGCCNHAQLGLDGTKVLGAVTYNYHRLLHCASCDICRPDYQLACVQLACARYSKEARCGVGGGSFASQREVRVVLCRPVPLPKSAMSI